ncbi:MAG: hypothetical protein F2763_04630 [Actinobacteria bacterium]|uniref:Unannotated protein n=1 Tax=freshwater metagenome TaxID=449393 RepID=A0A6J7AFN0_9ZZZZ|nr:hypothetical protein [Actinomycetota bacterium]
MKRRHLWINLSLILAILLVVGAILGVALRPKGASAPARTATVVTATVSSTVTASGSVESAGGSVNQDRVLATVNQTTATQQLAAAPHGTTD